MRKTTLAGLCFALACGILVVVKLVARSQGVRLSWLFDQAYYLLVPLVLTPLLMIPLSRLNRRLLDWRKARGRDIEEEEKYERESGIISLREVPPHERASRDR